MKEKNKRLIILVSVLLLFGGTTLAYFVSQVLSSGKGSSTEGTTAVIKGSTLNVVGTLEFNDTNIYPGHKNVSGVKVTATGDNELIPYNLIWEGTNTLTSLNYTIYKTSTSIDVTSSCEKKTTIENGAQILKEECSISNIESLGSSIGSGVINKNDTKVVLAKDEFINSTTTGLSMYYYVILEYPNLEESQNEDLGGSFTGKVKVEGSNTEPDINIMAVYIEQEDGSYKESKDVPQSGFSLNKEKSTCSNGATPDWDYSDNSFKVHNFVKKGTECYLYFYNIFVNARGTILKNMNKMLYNNNFNQINTSHYSKTIFINSDNDGISYYFAGNPSDNYLKFAGFYWRIVRINGNGTIRIIYNGTTTSQTGTDTLIGNSPFNSTLSHSYVGFMYGDREGNTYENVHSNNNSSAIKVALDNWYKEKLLSKDVYIDNNTGFCGDRTPTDNEGNIIDGGYGTITTNYAATIRNNTTRNPSLKCASSNDYYTTTLANIGNKALTYPIGLITADEVAFAGAVYNTNNGSFYLYNKQNYWTMSPAYSRQDFSNCFNLIDDGRLGAFAETSYSYGIRPVINLRADIKLTGSGTASDPYIVEGAA